MNTGDYANRFGGFTRLIGQPAQDRLRSAHVCVIGVGGVGSWVVEALARCGIGALTLVDMDDICLTNTNRQLPAVEGAIGRLKVDALAERVKSINPHCQVHALPQFFTSGTAATILSHPYDFVVDAIDRLSNKVLLLAECRARNLPVITCGSAGQRLDPTQVRVADLNEVIYDDLLRFTRKRLRQRFDFPRNKKASFGIPAVFSPEPQSASLPESCSAEPPEEATDQPRALGCDGGLGSAVFVTATFGMAAAAEVVKRLTVQSLTPPNSSSFSSQ